MENANPNSCFTVFSIMVSPYTFLDGSEYKGLVANIMKILQEKYGICYEFKTAPSNRALMHYYPENDSYTGLVADLITEGYDLFNVPLTPPTSAFHHFDISDIFDIDLTKIIISYPKIEPDFMGFVKPFTAQVWLVWILCMVLIALSAFVVIRNSRKSLDVGNAMSRKNPMQRATMIAWKVPLGQAIPIENSAVQKVLVGFWLMVCLFWGLAYKCNLKAALILPNVVVPFRSLNEMVRQDQVGWILANGASLAIASQESKEGTDMKRLYDGASVLVTTMKSVDVWLKKPPGGLYAWPVSEPVALGYVANQYSLSGFCTFTVVDEAFWARPTSIFLRKGTSMFPMFNKILKQLHESGIFGHWKKSIFTVANRCIGNIGKDERKKVRPLGLKDMGGIFVCFGIGLTLAALIFVAEIVFFL